MPAPTNISFATATDLGTTLPKTVTQQVDDSGTTYTVYYKYTAQGGDPPVLGVWGFGDLSVYKPTLTVWLGPLGSETQYLFITGVNKPVQMLVTTGVTYFFKIAPNGGNPTPANLTLNVQRFPNASTLSAGGIGVNDDTEGFPIAVLSGSTAAPLFFTAPTNGAGEAGAITTAGVLALNNENASSNSDRVTLFNSVLQPIITVVPFAGKIVRGIATDMSTRFYVNGFGIGTVKSYDTAGNFLTQWTLPDADNVSMAVDQANTILYTANLGVNQAIRRFDIVGNTSIADLVAGRATYKVGHTCIICLSDGTIVVAYYGGASTTDTSVRAYDAAGSTLHTYALGESNADVRLAMAVDDPASFWVWTKDLTGPGGTSTGFSTFRNIRVSDGVALTTLNAAEFEIGQYVPSATASPARFGHSESCIFWVTRGGSTPPTPTVTTTTQLLRRQRTAPHLSKEQGWIFYQRVQFDFQAGVGQVDGTYVDPTVMIQWSDDGGHVWSQEVLAHVGRIGVYKARAIIRRPHGRSRDRIYRVTVSDPVAWNLIGAYLEAEPGTRPF